MRTITLSDEQVEILRYVLYKRDDWGLTPLDYHSELLEVESQLQKPDPEQLCQVCFKPRREHQRGYSAAGHQFI